MMNAIPFAMDTKHAVETVSGITKFGTQINTVTSKEQAAALYVNILTAKEGARVEGQALRGLKGENVSKAQEVIAWKIEMLDGYEAILTDDAKLDELIEINQRNAGKTSDSSYANMWELLPEGTAVETQKNTDTEDGVRYAISSADTDERAVNPKYTIEIDNWDRLGRPDGEIFAVGETGGTLQGLGAMEQEIFIRSEKINKILQDHPEMTLDEIKALPRIAEDPILVLASRNVGRGKQNTRLVMFGTKKAQNGLPVMLVLDIRPSENQIIIDDMQKIDSAYTKTTNPEGFVRGSQILYASQNKATSLLRTIGFHVPIELNESGFIGSISYDGQNVNIQGKNFSEVLYMLK